MTGFRKSASDFARSFCLAGMVVPLWLRDSRSADAVELASRARDADRWREEKWVLLLD